MTTTISPKNDRDIPSLLSDLRRTMRQQKIDAVLVRSTDRFLNEYVPVAQSSRAFITGFTGSMGDALITGDRAILVVDGRYTLQASRECPDFEVTTVPLGTSIEEGWLALLEELKVQGIETLGVETDRVTVALFQRIKARADDLKMKIAPSDLVEKMMPAAAPSGDKKVWKVAKKLTGKSTVQRVQSAHKRLSELDGYLVVPLDELAWLTNLRGDFFPYQATFPAQGLCDFATGKVAIASEFDSDVFARAPRAFRGLVIGKTIGYDPSSTTEAARAALEAEGAKMVACEDPFSEMRTQKTKAELQHMADAFLAADSVVKKAQQWLGRRVDGKKATTEKQMADKVHALFIESGAWGLSFNVISAAGKNGAVIHYGTPDDKKAIKSGTLYLLDTGGYYVGGYATDLTRTFTVGSKKGPSKKHKKIFTTVLKGAIAGMSARIPRGTTGEALDAIVRSPIWRAGLNYAHGTGHGVGVNVHEFPPRIAPGVRAIVKPHQVFSIEPGFYDDAFGGVRIENLVTCVVDPEDDNFLRVKPLTFSPFDERLVDDDLLTKQERAFLKWFKSGAKLKSGKARLEYKLPPL